MLQIVSKRLCAEFVRLTKFYVAPVSYLKQGTEVFQRGGHDLKRCMNQVAELLGVILLLPVCLQTRGGVVACSTTFEGRRRRTTFGSQFQSPSLCPSRRESGRQKALFPIFNTTIDTLLYKFKHSYTTADYVLYKPTYIHTYIHKYIHIYHRKRDRKPYSKMK